MLGQQLDLAGLEVGALLLALPRHLDAAGGVGREPAGEDGDIEEFLEADDHRDREIRRAIRLATESVHSMS